MYVENVFKEEDYRELIDIVNEIDKENLEIQSVYGRLILDTVKLSDKFLTRASILANTHSDQRLTIKGNPLCVIYAKEYGQPNLPPHFDGDDTQLIMNYQLDSNTTWPVGIDKHTYGLKNNSAVMFHPNENIHWRPHKDFSDGEYVIMMFFRFYEPHNKQDYSHQALSQDDPVFRDILEYRNSLS